jgi:hypothetical protein
MSRPKPMSRFEHWMVAGAVMHNAAVKAAQAGQSPTEVSRLSIALYEFLHTIQPMVRKHGIAGAFDTPENPLDPSER